MAALFCLKSRHIVFVLFVVLFSGCQKLKSSSDQVSQSATSSAPIRSSASASAPPSFLPVSNNSVSELPAVEVAAGQLDVRCSYSGADYKITATWGLQAGAVQNVVRRRVTGGNWDMSLYVSLPLSQNTYTEIVVPGRSYDYQIKFSTTQVSPLITLLPQKSTCTEVAPTPAPAPTPVPAPAPTPTPTEPFEAYRWDVGVANGWFPALSPDGKYVTFGQGTIYFAELSQRQPVQIDTGSYSSQWIRPGVFTYTRPVNNNQSNRVEVNVSNLTPVATSDSIDLAAGNIFVARDGHWATYLAGRPLRVAYDNRLIQINNGGALGLGDDGWMSYASTNNNQALKVYHNGVFVREYAARTPLFASAIGGQGHVLYGGYGPVHGITPSGSDVDLTITPWRWEGVGKVFNVGSETWVATTTWDFNGNRGFILLRPFGSQTAVVVPAAAVAMDVVVTSSAFVLAFNDDKGRLTVLKVPLNSPREAVR